MQIGGEFKRVSISRSWLFIIVIVATAVAAALIIWWGVYVAVQSTVKVAEPYTNTPNSTPQLSVQTVTSGYGPIWDVAFLPTKEMIFNERKGVIHIMKDGVVDTLATPSDVHVNGEGGLLGLAVDPKFSENRYIYTCFNSTKGGPDVRVVRWRVATNLAALEARTDIITGMPANPSGRHSGCRIAFGPDGYLWVGTGDTARGDIAIQPKSLGGKILRVDRDGKPAPGNVGGQFDPRIYSYGHRNVQAIAFFPTAKGGALGISVEHGSSVDDEVNLLLPGNFGWAPPALGYDESVPMTDKKRFPDAIDAFWTSGKPTQAPSGATFLNGSQWKAWDARLVIAVLKAEHLKVLNLSASSNVASEDKIFIHQFGRLRTAVQGPGGDLYLTTDNPSNNQIIRITPH